MADAAERTLIGGGTDSSNEGVPQKDRLLALEIRSRKFGFAVFDAPPRLLEWGVRHYTGRDILKRRIAFLLELYVPTTVVLRRRDIRAPETRRVFAAAVRTIRAESRRLSIEVLSLNTLDIRHFFAEHGCATKHQIASLIAKRFDELSWKLPPKRKAWESENYNAAIFDAVATALLFFTGGTGSENKM